MEVQIDSEVLSHIYDPYLGVVVSKAKLAQMVESELLRYEPSTGTVEVTVV